MQINTAQIFTFFLGFILGVLTPFVFSMKDKSKKEKRPKKIYFAREAHCSSIFRETPEGLVLKYYNDREKLVYKFYSWQELHKCNPEEPWGSYIKAKLDLQEIEL